MLKLQKILVASTQGIGNSRGTGASEGQETLEERGKGWTVELVPRWSFDSVA